MKDQSGSESERRATNNVIVNFDIVSVTLKVLPGLVVGVGPQLAPRDNQRSVSIRIACDNGVEIPKVTFDFGVHDPEDFIKPPSTVAHISLSKGVY